MYRFTLALLIVAVVALQYKAWFGDVGYFANAELEAEVAAQAQRTAVLNQRNRILTAEVLALQSDLIAVESRARANLGMIKEGETFYLVNSDPQKPAQ